MRRKQMIIGHTCFLHIPALAHQCIIEKAENNIDKNGRRVVLSYELTPLIFLHCQSSYHRDSCEEPNGQRREIIQYADL